MAQNKTVETKGNVNAFIKAVKSETKRNDSMQLIEMLKELTGKEPRMWGPSIVGFGSYHYKYESGREGDMPLVGFSPRASALTFYLSTRFEKREELLEKLGKYKTGKGCLYFNKLEDIDVKVLQKMIVNHMKHIKKAYPETT
ncbi:MAG: DUF1801 domain-containing protein [Cyclobacteriaceae bacterium]|nr:DUF1801 domain-containing protein [Cyclobacteriaceae bacterium]